jgi:NAD-dependent dihydropyrimidine dehydrogenase PreA subunit
MPRLRDAFFEVVETCLRVLPWPTVPRLIRVGRPGRDSPVLLTCNYDLTVRRVLSALRGENAFLLVAPTQGINVWCSAAGGMFTAHQVISILRTSGIEREVDHRRLILPQLSATGVERKLVEERTGWHAVFGPVEARDLPEYLSTRHKTNEMRQVRFPLLRRLEMAVSWAFPIAAIGGVILALGWPRLVLPFVAMAWALAFALFGFFPWLGGGMEHAARESPGWTRYLVFFDPSIRRILLVWLVFVAGLCGFAYWKGAWNVHALVGWSVASLFIVMLVGMDLAGSTPLYKSGLHEDRLLHIELDAETCQGRAMCWEVCPKNCYVIDTDRHKAVIALADACVQCGACVVQCPEDALAFVGPSGERIPPETIRTYKLNLLGRRAIAVPPQKDVPNPGGSPPPG